MKPTGAPILVVLAIALAAPAVRAADPSVDPHRRYTEGAAAFDKGDFERAVAAFADVYRATGETKHLWNLALAEYRARHAFDAATHLHAYVAKPDASPTNLTRAGTLLDELAPQLAHLAVTAPAGADVILDGAKLGVAPLAGPVDLDPAKPHVVIARSGADEVSQSIPAPGPTSLAVTLSFPRASPPPSVAAAPAAPVAPPSSPPAAAPETAPASRSNPARVWITVGLGAGAVLAAAGGVYMGMQSSSAADDAASIRAGMPTHSWCANPDNAGCADLKSKLDTQGSDRTASMVLYGGAGVLAAGAVVAWLVLPKERAAVGAVTPLVGPRLVGAGWAASF
jgi:hypothetical protein